MVTVKIIDGAFLFFIIHFVFYLMNSRFNEKSTSTKTHIKPTSDPATPFVDFVVCPSYQKAYKQEVIRNFGLEREQYKDGVSFYPLANETDLDPRSFYDKITHNFSEIFDKIIVRTLNQKEPKVTIDLSKEEETERIFIETKHYATFGRCFSIQMPDDIISNGIISIEFIANVDIYVYFGHPGQFMHVDTKSKVSESNNLLG